MNTTSTPQHLRNQKTVLGCEVCKYVTLIFKMLKNDQWHPLLYGSQTTALKKVCAIKPEL